MMNSGHEATISSRRMSWVRRPSRTALVAALLVVLAIFGAFIMTGAADRRPTGAEYFTANSIRRVLLPIHALSSPRPPTVSAAALVEGRRIYLQSCSMCHGSTGAADAPLANAFYPPVPDLRSTTRRWSDRELFWTVRNGIRMTGMPAWRSILNDQQTWSVVAYLRRLNTPRAASKQISGATSPDDLRKLALSTIDDEGCTDCHRIRGEGATVGPNLDDEWARGRSEEWLLGHFRNPKAYTPGSLMPSFSHLSDAQLKALVFFVQEPHSP